MSESPLCNLCGKSADAVVLFRDEKNGRTYATTRCIECLHKPEPQLNNETPYNNFSLWCTWDCDFVAGWNEQFRLTYADIYARLAPCVTLLSNPFEKDE